MASYRPYPPPSSLGPPHGQNPLPPPPPRPQSHGNQYAQDWGSVASFPQNYNPMPQNSNFHHAGYGSSAHQYGSSRSQLLPTLAPPSSHQQQAPPPPPPQQPPQQYLYPPLPPPPPDSSYQPPPPPPPAMSQKSMSVQQQSQPGPMYFPSSQYSQYSQQPLQPPQPPPPPPPPSSPPPSSSIPPPPPLSPPPPPPSLAHVPAQTKESEQDRGMQERERTSKGGNQQVVSKQQKPPVPLVPARKENGPSGRVETEEERRLRKKKEMERQRQEERSRQKLKESQNAVLRKTQMLSSAEKGHGSIAGSHMGERRTTPLLSSEMFENRLKKPTTFLCRMKFRNELPDPTAQPKLMTIKRDKDRFTRYTITSLEKMHKSKLYVEPDLGIPLDLLDLSVFNPPKERQPLSPEDEELLHDDEPVTLLKKDGIRRKDRPSDHGVSWLVKTQYISPLSNESTKQSLTEKQAKELRETREGRNILENLNDRERQIQEILASFEACKSRPVHATDKSLQPVEIFPLLPNFDRYDDQFVVANFDGEPTADSEMFSKMDKSVRDSHESEAIMKSFVVTGSDPDKPERFLGYMVPSPDELNKDLYDEDDDVPFSWVREYNWDVKGEDLDDIQTYLVSFDENTAHYLPLPTKLGLRKRRAKEGKSNEDVEQFAPPAKVTVRRRDTTAVIEKKDSRIPAYSRAMALSSRRGVLDDEDALGRLNEGDEDMGQYSAAEDDISE
ncbi:hypothetical protein Nepgr_025209 [Nepenthes gracilis]|uniref:Protein PAF1 homolog n=1 Tax=Nepenthes gracilis TaxID=150966 RepID=A0AAD3T696_NEPGR|nr:hypothetical protein Nepgr_025209 [Nepenthes gracilis]